MAYEGCPDNAVYEIARDLTHKHAVVARSIIDLMQAERVLAEASQTRVQAEVDAHDAIKQLPQGQRQTYFDEIKGLSGIGPKAFQRREDYSDCID